jgi:hypothetical protein
MFGRRWSGGFAQWNYLIGLSSLARVVFTYSASSTSNVPLCYKNGQPVSLRETIAAATGSVTSSSLNKCIGNRYADLARNVDGYLGDMMMWNRILTPAEVMADYLNPLEFLIPA